MTSPCLASLVKLCYKIIHALLIKSLRSCLLQLFRFSYKRSKWLKLTANFLGPWSQSAETTYVDWFTVIEVGFPSRITLTGLLKIATLCSSKQSWFRLWVEVILYLRSLVYRAIHARVHITCTFINIILRWRCLFFPFRRDFFRLPYLMLPIKYFGVSVKPGTLLRSYEFPVPCIIIKLCYKMSHSLLIEVFETCCNYALTSDSQTKLSDYHLLLTF